METHSPTPRFQSVVPTNNCPPRFESLTETKKKWLLCRGLELSELMSVYELSKLMPSELSKLKSIGDGGALGAHIGW